MDIPKDKPFFSIIIPVKNAEKYLRQCLNSLNGLNYPKDKFEVIISDSASKDKTREIATSLGAKVIISGVDSICACRNSGFKEAKGEFIVFSDADCVMDRDWLINSLKYFKDSNIGCVGGPSLTPEDETSFGKACGFIFSYSLFTGGSPYGRYFKEAREVKHNPGCNAIYRRSVLEKVMPIDERFTDGEDVIMNKKLVDLGYKFLFTPDTKLWHYRFSPPKRFFRQNFRYGIGKVLIGRAYKGLLNPLHIIVGFSLPIIFAITLYSWIVSIPLLVTFIFLGIGFFALFFFLALIKTRSLKVALNVPLAIILLMTGFSLGFMQEFFFPIRKK